MSAGVCRAGRMRQGNPSESWLASGNGNTVGGSNWGWDGHELSHALHRQESCCQQVPRVQGGGGQCSPGRACASRD